ncbi:restriction endonuclease [Arthrobacter celericrescens]|uniref:restriction endonuclease n=1 Tax=Arthrobacter celericrescens TaxID=2320851 RepID=UPI000EA1D79B|nr:restriction endonuclease [Arthrobacter celericrescens]
MTAWLVRAGSTGEREQWALSNAVTGAGYGDVDSLQDSDTREKVFSKVEAGIPGQKLGAVRNFAAQLWALRGRMELGDLVVMPLKRSAAVAIGIIEGPYEYDSNEPDPERRHIRRVRWDAPDIARSRINQDLLYSLGAFSTVCRIERNDAEFRLRTAMTSGKDPGARLEMQDLPSKGGSFSVDETEQENVPVDISRYAADSIASRLIETFAGHKMEALVAEILKADGFVCTEHGQGTDDGIDLVAGKGLLGLDSPRVIVQVKSQASPVDSPTVSQLHGSLSIHKADQGLLVAWGGLTMAARKLVDSQRFAIRVWDADELVSQVQDHYAEFPARVRQELPLKQIWTLADEAG